MIEFTTGDLFSSPCDALVNTVNCVGVMGRGLALEFKGRFPANFQEYQIACREQEVKPGKMLVHATGALIGPRYVINFPTKRHWRQKSKLVDIESGLAELRRTILDLKIDSIAIPPLGCGLGGLNWGDVRPKIQDALSDLPNIQIRVFEPQRPMSLTPGRAAMIQLMGRYMAGSRKASISPLEVQKLMYFLQESGEALRLVYKKDKYGPFSHNLRPVLQRIEGQLIYSNPAEPHHPHKQISLMPGALEVTQSFLVDCPATLTPLNRVADLVKSHETPFEMELLSTVHWCMTRDGVQSDNQIVDFVHDWNARKKKFDAAQIREAKLHLERNCWI